MIQDLEVGRLLRTIILVLRRERQRRVRVETGNVTREADVRGGNHESRNCRWPL